MLRIGKYLLQVCWWLMIPSGKHGDNPPWIINDSWGLEMNVWPWIGGFIMVILGTFPKQPRRIRLELLGGPTKSHQSHPSILIILPSKILLENLGKNHQPPANRLGMLRFVETFSQIFIFCLVVPQFTLGGPVINTAGQSWWTVPRALQKYAQVNSKPSIPTRYCW